jgi:hypothetical protein
MMNVTILLDFERCCLAGYLCAVVCLNVTMYLIASFYNKKFGEPTPKLGFIFSIVFSILCAASVFVAVGSGRTLGMVQSVLLILSAAASIISAVNLFLKMRKPRK